MPKGKYANPQHVTQDFGSGAYLTPVVYEALEQHYEDLNGLDRIARTVLALVHSAYSSQKAKDQHHDFVLQNIVSMNTVAAAASGDKLYLAANGVDLLGAATAIANALGNEGVSFTPVIVTGTTWKDKDFHAEMQLVSYLANNGLMPNGLTIGVSKPCCLQCAERLDSLGLSYSLWHDEEVGKRWKAPSVTEPWW